MRRLVNFLRGMTQVNIQGKFPERMLNLCAQRRLEFWELTWLDEHSITVTIHSGDLGRVKKLAERIGCTAEKGAERGLPAFLNRFRRRYAFLAGLALSLCAVFFMSRVVLTVEVSGNRQVPAARILTELRRLGLRPGVYGPALDCKQLAQDALLELEQLSWLTVNLYGTRAQVLVREAVLPPELTVEDGCFDVVARGDGIVTRVEALSGEPLVKRGDAVRAGDVLITGHVSMRPPLYSDAPVRYFDTCAGGRVWGRTLRTVKARIPMTAVIKSRTGQEEILHSLTIFSKQIDFFRNSSISAPFYDKITHVSCADPEGELPFRWTAQTRSSYEPETVEIDRQAAVALLEDELRKRLEKAVGEEGEVENIRFFSKPVDGCIQVTARAECREQLGKQVPAEYPSQPEETP